MITLNSAVLSEDFFEVTGQEITPEIKTMFDAVAQYLYVAYRAGQRGDSFQSVFPWLVKQ